MDEHEDGFKSVPEHPLPLPLGAPEPRAILGAYETDTHYIFNIRSEFVESIGSDRISILK